MNYTSDFRYAWRTRGPADRRALLLQAARASSVPVVIPDTCEHKTMAAVEWRAVAADETSGEFEGLGAVYNIKDDYGDVITQGAFDETLKRRNFRVPLLWNHQMSELIGLAELTDTDRGLRVKGVLNLAVTKAKEIYSLLKQGALRGLSIGFTTLKADWKGTTRFVREIELFEISLTPFPAQQLALVSDVKSRARGVPGDADTMVDATRLLVLIQEMRTYLIARRYQHGG